MIIYCIHLISFSCFQIFGIRRNTHPEYRILIEYSLQLYQKSFNISNKVKEPLRVTNYSFLEVIFLYYLIHSLLINDQSVNNKMPLKVHCIIEQY